MSDIAPLPGPLGTAGRNLTDRRTPERFSVITRIVMTVTGNSAMDIGEYDRIGNRPPHPEEVRRLVLCPRERETLITELTGHRPKPKPVDLSDRIDPTIAVDRALTAENRALFSSLLAGPWQGAQPADYLDEAINTDTYAGSVEQWWSSQQATTTEYLAGRIATEYDLPEVLADRLLHTAVVACIVLGWLDKLGSGEAAVELAGRAALYARGMADALGIEVAS
jgi:hypothetical protein